MVVQPEQDKSFGEIVNEYNMGWLGYTLLKPQLNLTCGTCDNSLKGFVVTMINFTIPVRDLHRGKELMNRILSDMYLDGQWVKCIS